jgi:hypothetical protein
VLPPVPRLPRRPVSFSRQPGKTKSRGLAGLVEWAHGSTRSSCVAIVASRRLLFSFLFSVLTRHSPHAVLFPLFIAIALSQNQQNQQLTVTTWYANNQCTGNPVRMTATQSAASCTASTNCNQSATTTCSTSTPTVQNGLIGIWTYSGTGCNAGSESSLIAYGSSGCGSVQGGNGIRASCNGNNLIVSIHPTAVARGRTRPPAATASPAEPARRRPPAPTATTMATSTTPAFTRTPSLSWPMART